MAVILRSSKSKALTHTEMDGNFTDLNNRTTTVEANYIKTINSLTATNNALTITTTNITEGTNLYYTNTRARASISVTDSGGDGSLSYSSSTGVVTYTGPSAAEVRAHISAGAGITVSSGAISIGADAIKDTMIDWGTGATQVSTADIPENTNLYYTNARADARITAASIADLSNVTLGSLVNGYGLVYNSSTSQIELAELPGATGGEANKGASLGGYNEVYSGKSGVILQFRTLNHDSNITITQSTNYLTIGTASAPIFGNLQLKTDTIENINTNAHIILNPNGTGAVKIGSNLLPSADSTHSLGASGTEWANVYADTVYGTLATAAQAGILSVGALLGLTIAGTQTVSMGSNKITNVTDPAAAQDAATKAYVDANQGSFIIGDGSTTQTIANGNTITFSNVTNETTVAVSATDTVTIGLPAAVTVTTSLTVPTANITTAIIDQVTITDNNITTNVTNADLILKPSGTGKVKTDSAVDLGGALTLLESGVHTGSGEIRFADYDSSRYVGFKSGATVAANIMWTLPNADASVSGYALVSDSAGTLSWAAAGATVTQDNSTNTAFNLYYAATTSGALTAVKYDGTDMTFNPSTSTLACATFSGALAGNASGSSGSCTGNSATATVGTTVTLTATNTTDATHFPTFVDTATGNEAVRTDTGYTYNPSSGTLTSTIFAGTANAAKYADLAENYLPDTSYPIGTVVMIGGVNEITYCPIGAIPAGVVSENPAYLMNSEQEGGLPVALVGRVKVRIVGKVRKGQLMRVDLNGVASATADGAPVGIAIEESDDVDEKLIECLLKV